MDKELNRRVQLYQEMEKKNKIISEEMKKLSVQCSELTDKNDALEANLRDYFKVSYNLKIEYILDAPMLNIEYFSSYLFSTHMYISIKKVRNEL